MVGCCVAEHPEKPLFEGVSLGVLFRKNFRAESSLKS
ncbi:MAG: hypothetical protein UV01_C0010G0085 [Parcubacteria group bacterium GW2011_GWA2_42_14]|nr:MAG: hypothetical protein UV01_C0010G0085 [Parcubacteria group bacterium GW2011_GWA2_42_14]